MNDCTNETGDTPTAPLSRRERAPEGRMRDGFEGGGTPDVTGVVAGVASALALAAGEETTVTWRRDRKGVLTGWCRLPSGEALLPAARAIAELEGRLAMVTPYLPERSQEKGGREIAYHFDLDGATLTLTVTLPLEWARIPSLTPIFRNCDWQERELMELYDVQVVGHPDPRRLFLDHTITHAPFERLVPYSTFSNAATGKALWDRVLGEREDA
ncbi:NADH-quinone oxidoreductase subunit C [Geomonas subterranea]|uniref:NADH-quinone oxidoreductase subunit C n=1 Tax=Geomonas subterranea TaxID=2847989 RepID=A0ABX8LG00_9BACT|nr:MULTISPECIES: NADH-quinone oxidoreductase subunit C [Geomonas]QXE89821.1 NADH-quinone oxidoreductase subunit C [Geomonas subterranea]QXM08060.1 NADH-quinone oxidoreductase subunit C [Geomonas subterranea]